MSYASGFMLGASIGKAIHNMVSSGGFSPAGGRGKGMGKQAANPSYAAPAMPAAPVRPNIPAFACVSSTRGRRRYRAAALVQNQPLAELLQQALGSLPAARRVEVNAATGSILVCSDNEGALDTLERYLGERIFPAVPAPPYVPAPVQTKTAASAYTDVLYETLNFLNSAVSLHTYSVSNNAGMMLSTFLRKINYMATALKQLLNLVTQKLLNHLSASSAKKTSSNASPLLHMFAMI